MSVPERVPENFALWRPSSSAFAVRINRSEAPLPFLLYYAFWLSTPPSTVPSPHQFRRESLGGPKSFESEQALAEPLE